jgi:hypothetical protein
MLDYKALDSCRWLLTFQKNIVKDLLKAFLGNGSVNTVNTQQWKMCLSERMLLLVDWQQAAQQWNR